MPSFLIEAALAHLVVNLVAQLAPVVERPFEPEGLRALDRAIEGDPGHDLGIGEMLRRPAHFPDALIGLAPDILEMFEKRDLSVPSGFVGRQPAAPRLMIGVHDLAEHVELQLGVRRIADAHRRGFLVAGQPVGVPFGEPPLAADAVHDLQLIRAAGDRAQQPFAPSLRFFVIAGMHGAEQRQRGVAQPAIAVIPIALAAEPLRQRRGRRGDDAAGRPHR